MRNDIVTSKSGKQMLDYILPIYDNDAYMLNIFEANGKELDDLWDTVKSVREQVYPQFASWSLSHWEDMLGIDANRLSVEERRQKVLVELNRYAPITRKRMEDIVNQFVPTKDAEVIEFITDYAFEVVLPIASMANERLKKTVEEVKPAHLLAVFIGEFYAILISFIDNSYDFHVTYPVCGDMPPSEAHVSIEEDEMHVTESSYDFGVEYEVSETKVCSPSEDKTVSIDKTYNFAVEYPICGEMQPPQANVHNNHYRSITKDNSYTVNVVYPVCGDFVCGEGV